MADTTRRICSICGMAKEEWDMKAFNTGRRNIYMCLECYRHANQDMISIEAQAKKRFRKGAKK